MAGTGLDWTFAEKAQGADWGAFIMRTVSLMLSVGGMLVTALLLGLVSDAIGSKVDDLRKGKAPVLENGHTLIIGCVVLLASAGSVHQWYHHKELHMCGLKHYNCLYISNTAAAGGATRSSACSRSCVWGESA